MTINTSSKHFNTQQNINGAVSPAKIAYHNVLFVLLYKSYELV